MTSAGESARFTPIWMKIKEKPYQWLGLALSCTVFLLLLFLKLPLDWVIQATALAGYYFCFILFILLIATTFRVLGDINFSGYLRARWRGLLVVLIATIAVHLFQPYKMGVFNDEPAHQLNAMMMHLERQNSIPEVGYQLGGGMVYADRSSNFRMYFYPFLVSIVHDLTGFRHDNGLFLNAIAGGLLFLLVYLGGNRIHAEGGGVLAVMLLLSLPLLDEVITSYGYDTVNLLFIAAVFLGLSHYAERPTAKFLNWTVILAICAAYTRNESLLYLIPVITIFLIRFFGNPSTNITKITCFSPLLLLPAPAAKQIFGAFMDYLHIESPEVSSEQLFSLASIPPNLVNVGQWMFDFSSTVPASPVLVILGLAGLIALTVTTLSKFIGQQKWKKGDDMFLAFATTAVIAFVFVTLSWFWNPASGAANRLLLPFHLCLTYLGVWFIANSRRPSVNFKRAALGMAVFIFLLAIPTKMRDVRAETRVFAKYVAWAGEWLVERSENRPIYISQVHTYFLFHGHPSVGTSRGNSDIERLCQLVVENYYGELIVFEIEKYDAVTGIWTPSPPAPTLDAGIITEIIDERRWSYNQRARFLKVLGFSNEEGAIVYLSDLKPMKYEYDNFNDYIDAMNRLHPGLIW